MTTREKLHVLANNLWWSWNPEALSLFERLNPEAFRDSGNNPLVALRAPHEDVLEDPRFQEEVDTVYDVFSQYMQSTPAYPNAPHISYFCMEYGLHESMPLYSGGLGILAGDHAKTASDLGLPFTAVGLFLREGYFQQHFTEDGWQQAAHPALDPADHAFERVVDESGEPVTVRVHLGSEPVEVGAWLLRLGRTSLYLLDTHLEANSPEVQGLTRKLYQGGQLVRLQQEIVLGIGGLRMLRALGVEADLYHLNEGHCTFLTLELLRERLEAGEGLNDAEEWVREHCVFTTHTPVPAGHDRFDPDRLAGQLETFRQELGMTRKQLLSYGRINPEEPEDGGERFTMTVLGLKLSSRANGVSRINGHVARQQWQELYPERSLDEVPIGSITNGVHLPTWTVPHARAFLNQRLGNWLAHQSDPAFWEGVREIPDEDLWDYRCALRRLLLTFVEEHVAKQTLPMEVDLDPDALTIGFARRFATYKRAPLLFFDPERAAALFERADRPIQVLYAGKAHPADEGGKRFIHQIYEMSQHPAMRGKLIFLENYNIEIGRMLISGCDLWLNNPRRPYEASGTSGQKVAAHGGLNCSILDGWWPEGYTGKNGWAIGPESTASLRDATDHSEQDQSDAEALYDVLEHEVIPTFYDCDGRGIPTTWVAYMREAMATLAPTFSSERMVRDYVEEIYRIATSVRG